MFTLASAPAAYHAGGRSLKGVSMTEEVEVCFITGREVIDRLRERARTENLSVSDLVQAIISRTLAGSSSGNGQGEKREHKRRDAGLPAVIKIHLDATETHYGPGTIRDISLGGAKILLAPNTKIESEIVRSSSVELELLFAVEEELPVALKCRACRVDRRGQELLLGTRFVDVSPWSRKSLLRLFA